MVLARSGKFLHLQMGSRTDTVSIDRLKPVQGPDPVPQQPPLRGRPPRPAPNTVPVLPAALLDGILHDVHVLQPHLLFLNDDAGGELL